MNKVVLKLKKITPGALQYEEVELDGVVHPDNASQNDKLIGSMYFRKAKVEGAPKIARVTVEFEG